MDTDTTTHFAEELSSYSSTGNGDFPRIAKEEIEDKSNGDVISNTLRHSANVSRASSLNWSSSVPNRLRQASEGLETAHINSGDSTCPCGGHYTSHLYISEGFWGRLIIIGGPSTTSRASSFTFPSGTELWRAALIGITTLPILFVVAALRRETRETIWEIGTPPIYMLSRSTLLVLPLLSLRSLPPAAYRVVHWT